MSIQRPAHLAWLQPTAAGPALAAALLALAVFAVTLGGTYVYDDFDVFALDPRLRHPGQWYRYWTESYNFGVDNLYRPLVSMTYAIQWWLHGADARIDESDAWKYHAVNLLLHAAVSACVAELARRLTASLRVAYSAGLLFAVHPIHVEAVANIVGRAELMCALGVLGALVLFLRPLTTWRAITMTACMLVAVLSKEQGLLTPLLLLILAPARRAILPPLPSGGGRGEGAPQTERTAAQTPSPRPSPRGRGGGALLLIILLTWTLATYIFIREQILKFGWDRSFLDWTINPLVRPDADRWLMPLALLGRYASLLFAPVTLSPDYGGAVIGWTISPRDPHLWIGIAAVLAWLAWFILALVRRRPIELFLLLSLALTYGVVSNFPILIGTNFGERLMYLPSAFFLILIAALVARLPRVPLVVVVTLVVAGFSIRAFSYAMSWNDRLRFYQESLARNPGSVRLPLLLISEHLSRGRFDEAERRADALSQQFPDYWESWIARANVAMERGKFDEAHEYLMRAATTPRAPMNRVLRWMMLLEQKRNATTAPTSGPGRE